LLVEVNHLLNKGGFKVCAETTRASELAPIKYGSWHTVPAIAGATIWRVTFSGEKVPANNAPITLRIEVVRVVCFTHVPYFPLYMPPLTRSLCFAAQDLLQNLPHPRLRSATRASNSV